MDHDIIEKYVYIIYLINLVGVYELLTTVCDIITILLLECVVYSYKHFYNIS
jgi:hypothetical protein